ncbi:MAG TPA: aminoglycoside adenylyltransferase domain-containing protein [Chloroflexia bacterium]
MSGPVGNPTPYAAVNEVLGALLAGVQRILGPDLHGMYLYGSLALGDFTPHRSDIDAVVVTAGELTDAQTAALQALHSDLATRYVPWGSELEVTYMPQRALRRYDPADARYPSIQRGERLVVEAQDSSGVVQRHVLREHGITLAGPPIREQIDPVPPDDLRRAVLAMARGWLAGLRADPRPLRHQGYQGYVVMTICRMFYTLQFGTIVSKPAACRWARGVLGRRWAPLIDRALAEDVGETVDMIAFALDRVRAYPEPGEPSPVDPQPPGPF